MTTTDRIAEHGDPLGPIHPGEIPREEFLVPLALSAYALAVACHVPRTRIERLVREETPVTPDTALPHGALLERFWRAAWTPGSCRFCSEWRHTAREQPSEARITYRYHPRFGEVVQIRRRLESGGVEFVVILQPNGSFACLPAWMTEPAASCFRIGTEVRFPLHIQRYVQQCSEIPRES